MPILGRVDLSLRVTIAGAFELAGSGFSGSLGFGRAERYCAASG